MTEQKRARFAPSALGAELGGRVIQALLAENGGSALQSSAQAIVLRARQAAHLGDPLGVTGWTQPRERRERSECTCGCGATSALIGRCECGRKLGHDA